MYARVELILQSVQKNRSPPPMYAPFPATQEWLHSPQMSEVSVTHWQMAVLPGVSEDSTMTDVGLLLEDVACEVRVYGVFTDDLCVLRCVRMGPKEGDEAVDRTGELVGVAIIELRVLLASLRIHTLKNSLRTATQESRRMTPCLGRNDKTSTRQTHWQGCQRAGAFETKNRRAHISFP
uniref:Uncharacterized protein n=1 Tax=Moniliophthora roreri TaxID=221103 RepID=A0A0W0F0G0_MONRR